MVKWISFALNISHGFSSQQDLMSKNFFYLFKSYAYLLPSKEFNSIDIRWGPTGPRLQGAQKQGWCLQEFKKHIIQDRTDNWPVSNRKTLWWILKSRCAWEKRSAPGEEGLGSVAGGDVDKQRRQRHRRTTRTDTAARSAFWPTNTSRTPFFTSRTVFGGVTRLAVV